MNTKLPNSQRRNDSGQAIADLTNDIRDLTGNLDSFALSFTLAWRQHPDHQRQHSPITQPERTGP